MTDQATQQEQLELLAQCRHRLLRMMDYSMPGKQQVFGVPDGFHQAMDSLASLENKIYDAMENGRDTQPRLHISSLAPILYLLEQSDKHLVEEEKRIGGDRVFRQLADDLVEMVKNPDNPIPRNITAPNPNLEKAARRFIAFYHAELDGDYFGKPAPVKGEIIGGAHDGEKIILPFSLERIDFSTTRLALMLESEKPSYTLSVVDFHPSRAMVANLAENTEPGSGDIVIAAFNQAKKLGYKDLSDKPFGIPWGIPGGEDHWGKLHPFAKQAINDAWGKVQTAFEAAKPMFDNVGEAAAFLNAPTTQMTFIERTLDPSKTSSRPDPKPTNTGTEPLTPTVERDKS